MCLNRVSEDVSSEVSVRDCMALKVDGHHVAVVGLEAERLGHENVPVRNLALNKHMMFIHTHYTGLLSCVVYKPGMTERDLRVSLI